MGGLGLLVNPRRLFSPPPWGGGARTESYIVLPARHTRRVGEGNEEEEEGYKAPPRDQSHDSAA